MKNTKDDTNRIIEVVQHNDKWKEDFAREAEKISEVFQNILIDIHHIGSTAIRDIKAKPVIDILVEVEEINKVDKYNEEMAALGYVARGEYGIAGRRYFYKGNTQHTHHLHVFEEGNKEINRHLIFTDYLNAHLEEAEEYSLLKEGLAEDYRYDPAGYTKGKNDFIKKIDNRAKNWYEKERLS